MPKHLEKWSNGSKYARTIKALYCNWSKYAGAMGGKYAGAIQASMQKQYESLCRSNMSKYAQAM